MRLKDNCDDHYHKWKQYKVMKQLKIKIKCKSNGRGVCCKY